MIYPTRLAILLTAAGAPLALLLGIMAPGWWLASAAWIAGMLALMLVDAVLAPWPARLSLQVATPAAMGVGSTRSAGIAAAFPKAAPGWLEVAMAADARVAVSPDRTRITMRRGQGEGQFDLTALRRGEAVFERLWARWRGPLGLVWIQREEALGRRTTITPDVEAVKDQALKLFARDALFGMKAQLDTGEGSDFHALKDFTTGMDLRSIDWKQSARHARLVGKEYRTERNHHVIMALDTGRLMCAPLGGQPRIDRAINAALLLAFVSLKLGDRVGLFAFDARPRASSGAVSGTQAFGLLQRLAASLDYSAEETNFTLGLTTLSGKLDRRSMVVVFTDFADPTSAELMIENLGRLLRTHLVVFVVFKDEELEAIVRKEPVEPDDVSRAVVGAALMAQREVVLERLRRMGARIVEASADRMGGELVNSYLDAKRRDLL